MAPRLFPLPLLLLYRECGTALTYRKTKLLLLLDCKKSGILRSLLYSCSMIPAHSSIAVMACNRVGLLSPTYDGSSTWYTAAVQRVTASNRGWYRYVELHGTHSVMCSALVYYQTPVHQHRPRYARMQGGARDLQTQRTLHGAPCYSSTTAAVTAVQQYMCTKHTLLKSPLGLGDRELPFADPKRLLASDRAAPGRESWAP